ncbi:5'-methylthioadenosine/S-adenosylhomocysteine nucleosidase [Dictyobacter arantiisoli]|uniref:Nucleoside phosphorylase domain-containing protein n=1 Tax=Dictyobacter arantiisoli TaxID=2014874 RepID=A0A5A5T8J6_9CHLR|nr:5'-methylthioadenosine/S-adenosylhomocysteine nucleosidase [Dictyobacter arantiisoli]GCF07728.1 hypothetical protein KDI_12920 [Dictyobacter arantiisoli]
MITQTTDKRAVILTALEVEFLAVLAHLRAVREEIHKGTVYTVGSFIEGSQRWEICLVQTGAGNNAAAFEAERAINYFQPQIILFVGVAGGIKDVRVGDVVAATKVYGYESGKSLFRSSFRSRPDVGESSYGLIQRARAEARKNNWRQRLLSSTTAASAQAQESEPPIVLVGAIAAGEKVLASADAQIVTFLKNTYNDTLAVEMEGRGLLKAAHANEPVKALIIRGISDLLDNKQNSDAQGSQPRAASAASAFAFEILAQLDPPVNASASMDTAAISATQSGAQAHVQRSAPPASQQDSNQDNQPLQLADVYISEDNQKTLLDLTFYNAGSRPILLTRVLLDILDVGPFYREAEDSTRSFLPASQQYEVELAPDMQGQQQTLKVSQQLQPGESDRIQLNLGQCNDDPGLAYVWYRIKLTIPFHGQSGVVLASEPLLLSFPPVNLKHLDVWDQRDENSAVNLATLQHMSTLTAERSRSVATTIQKYQR